eukprot:1160179-Pelagomonas_calceolata.AAC.8
MPEDQVRVHGRPQRSCWCGLAAGGCVRRGGRTGRRSAGARQRLPGRADVNGFRCEAHRGNSIKNRLRLWWVSRGQEECALARKHSHSKCGERMLLPHWKETSVRSQRERDLPAGCC